LKSYLYYPTTFIRGMALTRLLSIIPKAIRSETGFVKQIAMLIVLIYPVVYATPIVSQETVTILAIVLMMEIVLSRVFALCAYTFGYSMNFQFQLELICVGTMFCDVTLVV
jgi:hypothetical protein